MISIITIVIPFYYCAELLNWMQLWCLSYLFCIQRGLLPIKRIIWHHWHLHIEPAVFFGLCIHTFMETYLLQGLNLISAACSTLSFCTVGSVSHPSRCHCFDFREGHVGQQSHEQIFCLIQKISSRLPSEGCGVGGWLGLELHVRKRVLSYTIYDMLTKCGGAGNLHFLRCRTEGAGVWQCCQHSMKM